MNTNPFKKVINTNSKENLNTNEGEEGESIGSSISSTRRVIDLGNGSEVIYMSKLFSFNESWNYFHYLDTHIPWTRPTIRVFGRNCIQVPQAVLPDTVFEAAVRIPCDMQLKQVLANGKKGTLNVGSFNCRGMFSTDSYSTVRGVDKLIPVDVYLPGCPPKPEAVIDAIIIPRDTCYVASPGLPELVYSGYKPHAYSWDDYPPLKDILNAVHDALPGSRFNSLLLNRYKGGNDNVGWHADDEKLYGPTPEIASVSFGCEREFLMKKRPNKSSQVVEQRSNDEPACKRLKKSNHVDQHSFTLKHGSLLVMRGYSQRDWLHSVPKRAKADAARINLTFRRVL